MIVQPNNLASSAASESSKPDAANQEKCLAVLKTEHRSWLHYMDVCNQVKLPAQITRICLEKLLQQDKVETDGFGAYHYVFPLNEKLTIEDERDLDKLESDIRLAFFRAGNAFEEIRHRRLYKKYFTQFDDYCKQRFAMSESTVNDLIQAARVYTNISNQLQNDQISGRFVDSYNSTILPKNKSIAIQLAKVPEKEQLEACLEIATESKGKPTVAIAKEIVDRRLRKVSGSDDVASFDLHSPPAAANNEHNPTDDKAMRQPHRNVINKKEKMIKSSVIYKSGPVYIEGELLCWVISCKQQSVVERLKKFQDSVGAATEEGALDRLLQDKGF